MPEGIAKILVGGGVLAILAGGAGIAAKGAGFELSGVESLGAQIALCLIGIALLWSGLFFLGFVRESFLASAGLGVVAAIAIIVSNAFGPVHPTVETAGAGSSGGFDTPAEVSTTESETRPLGTDTTEERTVERDPTTTTFESITTSTDAISPLSSDTSSPGVTAAPSPSTVTTPGTAPTTTAPTTAASTTTAPATTETTSTASAGSVLNTVDDSFGASHGRYNDVTTGADGFPLISYVDLSPSVKNLMIAHCEDASCSTATISTLDNSAWMETSIAVGGDQLGIVAFSDFTQGLKVAHCRNTRCSSADVSLVDASPQYGRYASIAVGTDGFGVISYYAGNDLKVAKCLNAACSSATSFIVDDGVGSGAGWFSSIAIGVDGLPIISYYDTQQRDLKIAHCAVATCSASEIYTVADDGDVGWYTSIAIGTDGKAVVSFFNMASGWLEVVHCDNIPCSQSSVRPIAFSNAEKKVGTYSSISIHQGKPIIAFFDFSSGELKAARCVDALCSSSSVESIDPNVGAPFDAGSYTSITVGNDGRPFVSYYHVSTGSLRTAHLES